MAVQRLGSARDMVGRKREYETTYILRPDSTNDVIGQVNTKARGVIETNGGTIIKIDNWGKRKLAYEVQKQLKGIYLFFSYLGSAGLVEELERNLRLTDSVIRYYSVKIAENVDPAARTTEFTEEAFTKAGTPGPDEALRRGRGSIRLRGGRLRRRRRAPALEQEGGLDHVGRSCSSIG